MPTANTVIDKLQALIDKSNLTTSKSDTTLTQAIDSLIEGYGGGASNNGPRFIEEINYTQAEDWVSDEKGNGKNFANVYLNALDKQDRDIYYFTVSNNNAPFNYRIYAGLGKREIESTEYIGGCFYRGPEKFEGNGKVFNTNMSAYITRGANIKVLRFRTEDR